ncbi:sigma-70 family RNA polymerase sigma factor [Kitasatospora purpeofusca]|uniref:sigma-70 family RNA polymerase sigma factor n=1 Tax=Kitasatospora purpeofusca TaxID=67352 RepID=UPI0033F251B9
MVGIDGGGRTGAHEEVPGAGVDPHGDPPGLTPRAGTGRPVPDTTLPDDLVALMVMHGEAYWEYARLHLGDADAADDLVDEVFADLAANWELVLRQENLGEFCWGVLRSTVDAALLRRNLPSAFTAAAFAFAMDAAREAFQALESGIGLFAAIAELPERQHDAVVLTYVLGYPVVTAARIMGVTRSGLYSLRRDARRRLARALGLDERTAGTAEEQ